MAFETSEPVLSHILAPVQPPTKPSLTVLPTENQVFKCLEIWGASHLTSTTGFWQKLGIKITNYHSVGINQRI